MCWRARSWGCLGAMCSREQWLALWLREAPRASTQTYSHLCKHSHILAQKPCTSSIYRCLECTRSKSTSRANQVPFPKCPNLTSEDNFVDFPALPGVSQLSILKSRLLLKVSLLYKRLTFRKRLPKRRSWKVTAMAVVPVFPHLVS